MAAVHLANYVQGRHTPASDPPLPGAVDQEFIRSLNLQSALSTWEQAENPS